MSLLHCGSDPESAEHSPDIFTMFNDNPLHYASIRANIPIICDVTCVCVSAANLLIVWVLLLCYYELARPC